MPVVVEEYGYRAGSGGPGRYRGGCGLRFRLRAEAPETLMTVRGLERFVFRPYGLEGGRPGELYRVTLTRAGATEPSDLGKIDVLTLHAGDVVQFDTSSGGGFGFPFDRPVDLVLNDAQACLITVAEAKAQYGVVVKDGVVDLAASRRARARCSAGKQSRVADVGPERRAYEAIWSDETVTEMIRVLRAYPSALRAEMRNRTMERVTNRGVAVICGDIEEIVNQVAIGMGLAVVGAVEQIS
jgi:N-methylhydantoinase B